MPIFAKSHMVHKGLYILTYPHITYKRLTAPNTSLLRTPHSPSAMSNLANLGMTEPIHMKETEKGSDIDFDAPSHSEEREVVFEDYLHFAAIQRLEEDDGVVSASSTNWFHSLSAHKGPNVNVDIRDVKHTPMTIDEEERANASRALRLAGWAQIFYLITTDILGPFNAPFAISQVGWVPGAFLI